MSKAAKVYQFIYLALFVSMVGRYAWRHDTAFAVFFGVLACAMAAVLAFDSKR